MTAQEHNPEPNNPLGIDGIEFVEYATAQPLALGALLEQMGFVPTARHRSREVTLYRQGTMNVIVNADPRALTQSDTDPQSTVISAIALRVRDADVAYRHAIAMGAWAIQTRAGVKWDEQLIRVGLGAPDVLAAVRQLKQRGIVFIDREPAQSSEKGALTQLYKGGISFELVVSHLETDHA